MKNVVLSLVLFLLTGLLTAQILWQDEVILRKDYLLDWDNSSAATPDGGRLVPFYEGGEGQRGVWLQKLTQTGELAWEHPLLVYSSTVTLSSLAIVPSSDGNYFIRWIEVGVQVTKVDPQGQPLWDDAVLDVFTGPMYGVATLPDNTGGIYTLWGKTVTGFSSNIWCQHISSSGQMLIPEGGIELTNDVAQEDVSSVHLTSDGGVFLSYAITTSNSHNYRFLRLTPDYQIAWRIQITPDLNDHSYWVRSILSPDATNFTIIWTQSQNGQSLSQMQRISWNGELLFDPAILITTGTSSIYSSALLTSDNNIIMSIHNGTNAYPINNVIQKYTMMGEPLWGNGTPVPDSVISMSALKADTTGGAYFGFIYMINGTNSYQGTMLQHYDAGGQALIPGAGRILVPSLTYDTAGSISMTVTDKVTCIWLDKREEKYGLYYQIRDLNGDPLTGYLMPLREVLGGKPNLEGTIERSNDILAFWRDSRWDSASQPTAKHYFQIVNPDGSLDMPEDGAVLLDDVPGISSKILPLYLENGNTLFFFIDDSGSYGLIRAQAIDPQGNVLWGPNGMVIMDPLFDTDVSNLMVYSEGNDVYLSWSMFSPDVAIRTYIQKVVDGVPQWGPTGMMISSNDPGESLSETPLCFKDGFICLRVTTYSPLQKKLWLNHLSPDGTPSPGWTDGITVDEVLASNSGSYQAVSSVNQGVILIAYGYHLGEADNHFYYSAIDSQANVLISHSELVNQDLDQSTLSFDTRNGFVYCLKLVNWYDYYLGYAYNRIGQTGGQLWGFTTPQVVSEHESLSYTPSIIGLQNGACAIYWWTGSAAYCGYAAPDGSYLPLFGDQPIFTKCKIAPIGNLLNNELYLTWGDYKTAYFSYYGTEIRMQKLANTTVALDDPLVQHPVVNLSCYPNPFNPETTISFSLPSSGKVRLDVYNLRGQLVRSLIDTRLETGTHSVIWNGKDYSGRDSATGVYIFKLHTDQGNTVRKAMLLK